MFENYVPKRLLNLFQITEYVAFAIETIMYVTWISQNGFVFLGQCRETYRSLLKTDLRKQNICTQM